MARLLIMSEHIADIKDTLARIKEAADEALFAASRDAFSPLSLVDFYRGYVEDRIIAIQDHAQKLERIYDEIEDGRCKNECKCRRCRAMKERDENDNDPNDALEDPDWRESFE